MSHCYHANIETDTVDNQDFRRVEHTGSHLQVVLYALKPEEFIDKEIHPGTEQFLRVDEGSGYAVVDGEKYLLEDGTAMVIPAGAEHTIGAGSRGMKLYAIYSNQEHAEGKVEPVKGMQKGKGRAEKVAILTPVDMELMKAKDGDSEYINKDKTFKGGFDGCVRYQKEKKGLNEKSARKLCAYIGRRAGKIP